MIRFALLLLFLMTAVLPAKTDIDAQLKKTSAQINTFDKKYSTLNVKMARNAKAILKEKRSILKQQKQLQQLMLELGIKEANYETHKTDLKNARNSRTSLSDEQNKIEHELIFAITSNAGKNLRNLLTCQPSIKPTKPTFFFTFLQKTHPSSNPNPFLHLLSKIYSSLLHSNQNPFTKVVALLLLYKEHPSFFGLELLPQIRSSSSSFILQGR